MTSSLRDALRLSGALDQFKPVARDERPPRKSQAGGAATGERRSPRSDKPGQPGRGERRPPPAARANGARRSEEMDLAKAYALRAQSEQRERDRKLAEERAVAERRRVQREQVMALIEGRTLNRDDAETLRNFEYGGKIRRVYVTDDQLDQVNDGRLGVIQMRGRYLLVERALAQQVRAVDATAVALLVEPDTAAQETP